MQFFSNLRAYTQICLQGADYNQRSAFGIPIPSQSRNDSLLIPNPNPKSRIFKTESQIPIPNPEFSKLNPKSQSQIPNFSNSIPIQIPIPNFWVWGILHQVFSTLGEFYTKKVVTSTPENSTSFSGFRQKNPLYGLEISWCRKPNF